MSVIADRKKRRPQGRYAGGQGTLSAPNDAVKVALERALPVIAGLFSAIIDHKLGSRSAAEPPLIACDACGLDPRTVRRLVVRGKLAAVKVGRRWYAAPEALRALLPAPPATAPAND